MNLKPRFGDLYVPGRKNRQELADRSVLTRFCERRNFVRNFVRPGVDQNLDADTIKRHSRGVTLVPRRFVLLQFGSELCINVL